MEKKTQKSEYEKLLGRKPTKQEQKQLDEYKKTGKVPKAKTIE